MAVYTWNFKVNGNHTIVFDHPFKSSVVVTLDGKKVKESAKHEFTYAFDVEGKPCKLKIAYEEIDYGMAKIQSWVHNFSVDGISIKAQK